MMMTDQIQPLFVRKYGGTSLASPAHIQRVAASALAAQRAGLAVVLVVSAMSGETNRLLALAHETTSLHEGGKGGSLPPYYGPLPSSLPELDVVASTGEQVVAALTACAINASGGRARSFLGSQIRIITDSAHGDARIRSIETQRLAAAIKENEIPVIAGFQGVDPMGSITTLGRGGSDTTAVAIAAALDATACEIFTDVDGVYTADPNICPGAKKLDRVSYAHMLALSALGAKVLHERSVALAAKYSLPVHVRTSFDSQPGTWVVEGLEETSVTSLAVDKNVARIDVLTELAAGDATALLELLSLHKLRVEMATAHGKISLTIRKSDIPRIAALLHDHPIGGKKLEWTCDAQVARVSLVGRALPSDPSRIADATSLLSRHGIHVQTLRASEISLSFLVDTAQADAALRVLHDGFILHNEEN